MKILGISAFYRESAAALVFDGTVVAAAVESESTGVEFDNSFPKSAIHKCLQKAGASFVDIDAVVFCDKPLSKVGNLLNLFIAGAPKGFVPFCRALPTWGKHQYSVFRELRSNLSGEFNGKVLFREHYNSCEAGTFFQSPFDDAVILTIDGSGEWATAVSTISLGQGRSVKPLKIRKYPHSIGLLYSAFANFAGVSKYKLKELAERGDAIYADAIKEKMVDIMEDGSLWLDISYLNCTSGQTLPSPKFYKLFDIDQKGSCTSRTEIDKNMAASIQTVTEEIIVKSAKYAKEITGSENLCLAGDIPLLCIDSTILKKKNIFKNIYSNPDNYSISAPIGAGL